MCVVNQYRPKNEMVEAIEVTQTNKPEIEAFVGNECREYHHNDYPTKDMPYNGLFIKHTQGNTLAMVGYFVVKQGGNTYVYNGVEFNSKYEIG